MQELNGSNGVIANMLTGLNIDEFFTRTEPSCCGPLSYLSDALGLTLALTDSSGAVQNQYQYEPFGNAWSPVYNNTSTNSYQFTGRENDGESGYDLDYYRGRYYSPVFQRFISQDPIEFAGGDTNLYAYVGADAVSFRDPRGVGRIGGIVGGVAGGVLGAVGEGAEEAAAGTVVEPGGGTLVGAVTGAALGAASGAVEGYTVGSSVQDIVTEILTGQSRAPRKSLPNSIYQQLDPLGNIRSQTFYTEKGTAVLPSGS